MSGHFRASPETSNLSNATPIIPSNAQRKLRKRILIALVGYKFFIFSFILLAIFLIPAFNIQKYEIAIHWPPGLSPTLESHFGTWDSALYIRLALAGYQKGSLYCAFYPLWPTLIRACDYLAPGCQVVGGLLLSNLFSLSGLYLFYCFVAERHGGALASRALVLIVAFPGALFFNFIYTESLFLLLIVLFFFLMLKERYLLAGVCGFFLPLTRAIGILCLLPAAWHYLRTTFPSSLTRQEELGRSHRLLNGRLFNGSMFCTIGILAGVLAYFSIMYFTTGNPLEGFEAQRQFPAGASVTRIFDLHGVISALTNVGSLHEPMNSALDRLCFLLFLAFLVPVWRLDRLYFFYALVTGLVPAMSNRFVSYTRYVILCFPIYIALARLLQGKRFLFWYVVGLMGAIQVILLIRHINFYWAG